MSRPLFLLGLVALFLASSDAPHSGPRMLAASAAYSLDVRCGGECISPEPSGYVADLDAINANWPAEPAATAVEDLFRVRVEVGAQTLVADTHLFGGAVNVIPYHDADNVVDAAGKQVERGDAVIARYFPAGELGFTVKHHRPGRRVLSTEGLSTAEMITDFKLQDTHLGIVVGVERDGKPGAITLNNPQHYEGGRFGSSKYPMIFVKPVYPAYLSPAQKEAFRDNIRTMVVGFNAVSKFPLKYNGDDPLGAYDAEKVRQLGAMMVRAIAGEKEARSWFREDENLLYCAELAHVAASAGLLTPLNARTFVPLVGEEIWEAFSREIEAHQRGEGSAFTELNQNRYIELIDLALAPEDLEPVVASAPRHLREEEDLLAFRAMTAPDILDQFLQMHVPRDALGEEMATVQAELLDAVRPGVFAALGLHGAGKLDPARLAVDRLIDRLVKIVERRYQSFRHYRAALEPVLLEARNLLIARNGSGETLFIAPSLFHLGAQGRWRPGLLDLQYVGHGLHFSLVREEGSGEASATPTPTSL